MKSVTHEARGIQVQKAKRNHHGFLALHGNAVRVQNEERQLASLLNRASRKTGKACLGQDGYQVCGHHVRPAGPLIRMMLCLLDAGAPEEDMRGLADFFTGMIDQHYALKAALPSAAEAIRLEAEADADADRQHIEYALTRSPISREGLIATTRRHIRKASALVLCAERERGGTAA